VPQSHLGLDGTIIHCAVCGYSWIESRAMKVIDDLPVCETLPVPVERKREDLIGEREVKRLAQAARAAEAKLEAARARRRREIRGFALLAFCVVVPLLLGMLLPKEVARALPPTRKLYSLAGVHINVSGLEFRNVGQLHRMVDGVRVLAIQGEIVNVDGRTRQIPSLSFTLKDEHLKTVYEWRLESATRPIKPGEVSTFVTRVASPPETAQQIEIRFARDLETGSNASHDSGAN
jgi:hypothetical protein